MNMHNVLASRTHVLAQLVMKDGLHLSPKKQANVVSVEIVSNEAHRILLRSLQHFQHGCIAPTHRVYGSNS